MTSRLPRLRTLAVAALTLVLAALPAGAESRSAEDSTPVALGRTATAIAVVTRQAGTLRVTETLRGHVVPGQVIETRSVLPATGQRFVGHFVADAEGSLDLLGGPLGLFRLPDDDAGEATAALFRSLAALPQRDASGPDTDGPETLRALRGSLVAALSTATPRARAGAAHDLWRQPGLLSDATPAERAAVVAAFRAADRLDAARPHLVRVLGLLRAPESGPLPIDTLVDTLVDALVGESGEFLAPAVGRALRDLADDDAIGSLAAHVAKAGPEVRTRIAYALGEAGRDAARPHLETLLTDADAAVRKTAAVALGRLRSADAATALLRRFRGAETNSGVRRALVWALAQCNDDDAWSALRSAAESDTDMRLREFAAATLRNPRRSFVR